MLSAKDSFGQPLSVNAGNNQNICLGSSVGIGGTPTAIGGTAPYSYAWTPAGTLSSTTTSNPIATPTASTWYYVTVTDGSASTRKDSVLIGIYPVCFTGAGNDTSYCWGGSALLGSSNNVPMGGVNYAWSPAASLSSATAPRPTATPVLTTTYTLIVSSGTCPNDTDYVTVTVNQLPGVSAGPDTTIYQGQMVVLQGTGATQYYWTPDPTLLYINTPNPDAEPQVTTTYCLAAVDNNGCVNYDCVTVFVLPSDTLIFYNTFTPNSDGDNDFWYIGGIGQYPNNRLEIYNRYGRRVYLASPYQNLWNGRNFSEDLPDATYYYIFDPGKEGKKIIHGSVTIIR